MSEEFLDPKKIILNYKNNCTTNVLTFLVSRVSLSGLVKALGNMAGIEKPITNNTTTIA